MKIVKISVLLRSTDLVWDYKAEKQSDFWDDLCRQLQDAFPDVPSFRKKNGSFQHCFYYATDLEAEDCKKRVKETLTRLLPEQKVSSVILSAVDAGPEDLSGLKQNLDPESDPFLPVLERAIADAPVQTKPAPIPEKAGENAVPEPAPAPVEPGPVTSAPPPSEKTPDTDAEPPSLSRQAEKIRVLKQGLLGKIRRQRHAVDEVVQSIFECEMFSSHKSNAKLSTRSISGLRVLHLGVSPYAPLLSGSAKRENRAMHATQPLHSRVSPARGSSVQLLHPTQGAQLPPTVVEPLERNDRASRGCYDGSASS